MQGGREGERRRDEGEKNVTVGPKKLGNYSSLPLLAVHLGRASDPLEMLLYLLIPIHNSSTIYP